MSKRIWVICMLQLALWAVVGWRMYAHAMLLHDWSPVTILAPVGGAVSHPIFAQFTAFQTLHWGVPAQVTKLIIPMHIPVDSKQIKILLYENNKLLTWWKYPSMGNGVTTSGTQYAELPFVVPTKLSGDIKLVFDGTAIAYTDQAYAPGFFIEEQNSNYPNGNYGIANNEKDGDIGLQFISQKTNYDIFWEQFREEPLGKISTLLIFCAGFLLLSYIPIVCTDLGAVLLSKMRKRFRGE